MDSELDEREEAPIQRINGGAHGFDLNAYAGELADCVWTPDPTQPNNVIDYAIKIRALTGEDIGRVQNQFQELRRVPALINFQQAKLERCTPPREIERKQKQLDAIRDSDYTSDPDLSVEGAQSAADKAETARAAIEASIKKLTEEWDNEYSQIKATTDRLLGIANLTVYELLRSEFFSRVIYSHDIIWHGELLDFSKPAEPGKEPPDAFAGAFYLEVGRMLGDEKKAKRRSGGSANLSKRRD